MKPRYVLYKSHPERVGYLLGKKVVLVQVEPLAGADPHCCQCAFYSVCNSVDKQNSVGPGYCISLPRGVYKEVK